MSNIIQKRNILCKDCFYEILSYNNSTDILYKLMNVCKHFYIWIHAETNDPYYTSKLTFKINKNCCKSIIKNKEMKYYIVHCEFSYYNDILLKFLPNIQYITMSDFKYGKLPSLNGKKLKSIYYNCTGKLSKICDNYNVEDLEIHGDNIIKKIPKNNIIKRLIICGNNRINEIPLSCPMLEYLRIEGYNKISYIPKIKIENLYLTGNKKVIKININDYIKNIIVYHQYKNRYIDINSKLGFTTIKLKLMDNAYPTFKTKMI